MAGVRILVNKQIPLTDWNHEFVPVRSALTDDAGLTPLAVFGLLNPIDDSGNGYKVTKAGGVIKTYGLDYQAATGGSGTDYVPAESAFTVLVAFKIDNLSEFGNIINCLNLTAGNGSGFSLAYSNTDNKLQLRVAYASGGQSTNAFTDTIVQGKWYSLVFTFTPGAWRAQLNTGSVVLGGNESNPVPVPASPLLIGKSSTTGAFTGSVGFVAVYDGVMTIEQCGNAITIASEVMSNRGVTIG
ncbi:LamG domain-containing protein [Klebsiella quasipneumoniae]|uniref:LamG domain-containing protein n=1 Tax=Klebsiella quasipneumoniae TaxID=1463165 RepID=UPI001C25B599|nr:LamG domain-containing protein [Klebsiella quasipneumoniae]MBU8940187.1 LamG domain-containing protein [Klebsiella quasipneumoniae]